MCNHQEENRCKSYKYADLQQSRQGEAINKMANMIRACMSCLMCTFSSMAASCLSVMIAMCVEIMLSICPYTWFYHQKEINPVTKKYNYGCKYDSTYFSLCVISHQH